VSPAEDRAACIREALCPPTMTLLRSACRSHFTSPSEPACPLQREFSRTCWATQGNWLWSASEQALCRPLYIQSERGELVGPGFVGHPIVTIPSGIRCCDGHAGIRARVASDTVPPTLALSFARMCSRRAQTIATHLRRKVFHDLLQRFHGKSGRMYYARRGCCNY